MIQSQTRQGLGEEREGRAGELIVAKAGIIRCCKH